MPVFEDCKKCGVNRRINTSTWRSGHCIKCTTSVGTWKRTPKPKVVISEKEKERRRLLRAQRISKSRKERFKRLGYLNSPEARKKISQSNMGKKPYKRTPEIIAKNSGENCYRWRGGVTPVNNKIRTSKPYRDWRKSVLRRDNHTCQCCGKRGGHLHADHIMPFSLFPELRFDILNGRTLCKPCHRQTDTYSTRCETYDPVAIILKALYI